LNAAPIIAIPLDWEEASPTGYSKSHAYYALRSNYAMAISAVGGVPVHLPYDHAAIERYADLADGFLIPGGGFDIDPKFYGATQHEKTKLKQHRTEFEFALMRAVMARRKPILGICNGMQMLAVLGGGTMHQHLPDQLGHTRHDQPMPFTDPVHPVQVVAGTQLAKRFHSGPVNSSHHQAVATLGANWVTSAQSDDGIIEAIEKTDYPFCWGVQWHPEYHAHPDDAALFQALIEAAQ
jgi:putative glutamine amidotransferase